MTLFYSALIGSFSLDRISKMIILKTIPENSFVVISRFFYITNIKNTGICFGLFDNVVYQPVFIFASLIALGCIFIYIYRKKKFLPTFPRFCFGLICGGILGNLMDRIFYSGVIDFIDFRFWPVFNLADTFIVSGIISLMVFYSRRKDASCLF